MRTRTTLGVALVFVAGVSCAPADEPEAALHPSSGTLTVGDVEWNWVREGQGPVVFVLGSSVLYPKMFSSELRDHFALVFLDGRHFVPDYAPGQEALEEVDLTTFADDVEAARLALGYDEIVVVGHSLHGQIALEYADRYPESTSRIVLIGPIPFAFSEFATETQEVWEELASDERRSLMDARRATLDDVVGAAPSSRSFAVGANHEGPLYWADPAYDPTYVLEGLENGPAFGRLTGTLPTRAEARARLERIDIPILLVLGRLDFAVPYKVWERLIDGLEGVEYVLLDEDSHNPQTESPERFDPILIEWLTSN